MKRIEKAHVHGTALHASDVGGSGRAHAQDELGGREERVVIVGERDAGGRVVRVGVVAGAAEAGWRVDAETEFGERLRGGRRERGAGFVRGGFSGDVADHETQGLRRGDDVLRE